MTDPLGGDQFDVEALADAEIEKLLKQVCNKCFSFQAGFHLKTNSRYSWRFPSLPRFSVPHNRSRAIKFY